MIIENEYGYTYKNTKTKDLDLSSPEVNLEADIGSIINDVNSFLYYERHIPKNSSGSTTERSQGKLFMRKINFRIVEELTRHFKYFLYHVSLYSLARWYKHHYEIFRDICKVYEILRKFYKYDKNGVITDSRFEEYSELLYMINKYCSEEQSRKDVNLYNSTFGLAYRKNLEGFSGSVLPRDMVNIEILSKMKSKHPMYKKRRSLSSPKKKTSKRRSY